MPIKHGPLDHEQIWAHYAQGRVPAEIGRLPDPLRELVHATAEPFIQVVVDVEVSRMRFGRICLIGVPPYDRRP
jgi:hypothetical protein